ncbi:MAG: hypothetical protein JWN41_1177 [Thermoleophilia bacterium]|nr:hypothetical protein [Thermoleophilia bacterium]
MRAAHPLSGVTDDLAPPPPSLASIDQVSNPACLEIARVSRDAVGRALTMRPTRAQLESALERHTSQPARHGTARATTDETHRVALLHPEYDGFITVELRAQCDLDDLRIELDADLDRVLTAHHKTGPIGAGQLRPVDLELHPGSIAAPATSGTARVVDGRGEAAAPPIRITLATDRTLDCQLAGAVDGPWADPELFEQAAADLCAGRGSARRLARRIERVSAGATDPGWSPLPWRRA